MEKDQKEKILKINFLDSAIVTLIASAAFFILCFAFNCGYNSYFGVPLMFTNSSWSGVVYRIPQISDAVYLVFAVSLFVTFGVNIVKISNKSKSTNGSISIQRTILFMVIAIFLLIAIMVLLTLREKTIISYTIIVLLGFLLLYLLILLFSHRKITKQLSRDRSVNSDVSPKNNAQASNEINISQETGFNRNVDKLNLLLDAFPQSRAFFISVTCSLISIAFMLFFLYGMLAAYNQTSFCFIDESSIVLSTTDTNVVVMSVKYDNNIGKYINQNKYRILPQEDLAFYIKECGRVESQVSFDKKAWAIDEIKVE